MIQFENRNKIEDDLPEDSEEISRIIMDTYKVKSSRPSLREIRDKHRLGKDPDKSWCHHHTTSMIKLFWSQLMATWASAAAYGQGEKFSV